ncbi:glutamine amidotransferase-related protein [Corynebacterium timonense]|uniref:GMP synthase (Glutamine-hydrolysing) n=1 Tax=Corynebacterium timonense TaxID=441500 RepID=A0A1H1P1G2_9CORY|nr:glutamine amidotransferase [Corynebacterium timonense]SDS05057.1 GMP synthase (glutamine-hydrolysing) [Corynebacterium timonense]
MSRFLLVCLRNGEIGPSVVEAELNDILRATALAREDVEVRVIDSPSATIGDVSGFAGVIVGGSSLTVTTPQYNAWQNHVNAELRGLLTADVPVFFICFGMCWLVDALGGAVGHSSPEASGPTVVELTDAAHDDPLLADFPARFDALTGHTENPEVVPADLTVLATGPTTTVQVARWGEKVWACQFHAEMDAPAMKTRMDFFYDYGYFPLTDYDTIIASLPSVDVTWSNELLRRYVQHCRSE